MKKLFLSACLTLLASVSFAGGHEMKVVDELQPRWVGIGESTAEFNHYADDVSVTDQGTIIEFTPSYILDEQENGSSATYRVSGLATEFKRNSRDSKNIMHRFNARTLAPLFGLGIAKEFSISIESSGTSFSVVSIFPYV